MEEKKVVITIKDEEITVDYGEVRYHEFIGLIQTILQDVQIQKFLPIISKMVDEHFYEGEKEEA